jgi:hypothetical protein
VRWRGCRAGPGHFRRAPRARCGPALGERASDLHARKAAEATNSPSEDDVQAAVANIEQCYNDLLSERGLYMQRCKRIRETMAGDYDNAVDKGISKKLLKKIIKGREFERKISALTDDLEDDERSEHQMLVEKLGEFANTPLGKAALAKASGNGEAQAQAGA